jgi:patatin-like phospholipase/acyl hydrolase
VPILTYANSVMPPESKRFRILSLDGGGIKGAFSAAVLAEWEKQTGRVISDHFDLIAGTSTGGIIALGLGLGLPAAKILEFYQKEGPKIFPNITTEQKLRLNLQHLWEPRYSAALLRKALEGVFGEKRIKDSKCRLLIPAYDVVAGRVYLFKTTHYPRFIFDQDALAVEVALATAAAPTFFKQAEVAAHSGALYVDGGVWSNCPALAAVTEAVSFLQVPLDSIDLLRIGTLTEPASFVHDNAGSGWFRIRPGLIEWAPQLVGMMFRGQMEASWATANLLTGGRSVYVDATVEPGLYGLDAVGQIGRMVILGRAEAAKKANWEPVMQRFLNGQAVDKFVPSA